MRTTRPYRSPVYECADCGMALPGQMVRPCPCCGQRNVCLSCLLEHHHGDEDGDEAQ